MASKRMVSGIRWAADSGQGRLRLSWAFYALEASIDHPRSCVLTVPIAVIFHSLVLQQLWATLMAPSAGIGGRMPLVWADIPRRLGTRVQPLHSTAYALSCHRGVHFPRVQRCFAFSSYTHSPLTCFKSKNLRDSILIFSRYSYMAVLLAHRSLLHVRRQLHGLARSCGSPRADQVLPYGAAVLVVVVVGVTINVSCSLLPKR